MAKASRVDQFSSDILMKKSPGMEQARLEYLANLGDTAKLSPKPTGGSKRLRVPQGSKDKAPHRTATAKSQADAIEIV